MIKRTLLSILGGLPPSYLRCLPPGLAGRLFVRLFRQDSHKYPALFQAARLRYAPAIRMTLRPGCVAHEDIAFLGFYETELTEEIRKRGKAGGLMVDVGANYGYFSLLWADSNPKNSVIAVEASPRNLAPLKHNLHLNNLEQRIEVIAAAAGNATGKTRFDLGPDDQTGWGMIALNGGDGTLVEVDTVRLDEVLAARSIDRIDVLKVDAEGADLLVLEGCESLLKRTAIGNIYFERNIERQQRLGIGDDTILEFLKSKGYSVQPMDNVGVEFHAQPSGAGSRVG